MSNSLTLVCSASVIKDSRGGRNSVNKLYINVNNVYSSAVYVHGVFCETSLLEMT